MVKQMTMQVLTKKEYIASSKHNYDYNKKEEKNKIDKMQQQIKDLKKELNNMQVEYKQYKFIIPNDEDYKEHIKDMLVFAKEHNLKAIYKNGVLYMPNYNRK